jgi:hypothetical protein
MSAGFWPTTVGSVPPNMTFTPDASRWLLTILYGMSRPADDGLRVEVSDCAIVVDVGPSRSATLRIRAGRDDRLNKSISRTESVGPICFAECDSRHCGVGAIAYPTRACKRRSRARRKPERIEEVVVVCRDQPSMIARELLFLYRQEFS